MLQEAQRMSAPSAFSVSISTRGLDRHVQRAGDARALERLRFGPYSARVAIRPGISVSAMAIPCGRRAPAPA
jgi:hypothetical protein